MFDSSPETLAVVADAGTSFTGDGVKPKLDLELKTAYQAVANCYYCGVCLVDGPYPDFEVAYLAVLVN